MPPNELISATFNLALIAAVFCLVWIVGHWINFVLEKLFDEEDEGITLPEIYELEKRVDRQDPVSTSDHF